MLSVSGLREADLARSPLRYRSTASRLRFRSSVFWNVRSPLRSRSPDFPPALLRFPLRSHALAGGKFCEPLLSFYSTLLFSGCGVVAFGGQGGLASDE